MPYAKLTVDPRLAENGGALPVGFDVFEGEEDVESGAPAGQAVWIVTHASDATLVAELQTSRGLTLVEHGAGTWDGSTLIRKVSGLNMVDIRAKLDEIAAASAPAVDAIVAEIRLLLPADPRAS